MLYGITTSQAHTTIQLQPCTAKRCNGTSRPFHTWLYLLTPHAGTCIRLQISASPGNKRGTAISSSPYFIMMGLTHNGCMACRTMQSTSAWGIYPIIEHLGSAGKVCLCIVPDGADIIEALEAMVIQHLHKLEQGIMLPLVAENRSYWFYGSAFDILGNHPALAKVAGISSSSCVVCIIQVINLSFITRCGWKQLLLLLLLLPQALSVLFHAIPWVATSL